MCVRKIVSEKSGGEKNRYIVKNIYLWCEEVKIFKLNQNSTNLLWIHLEKAHKSDFDKIAKVDPIRNVTKAIKPQQPTIVSAFLFRG